MEYTDLTVRLEALEDKAKKASCVGELENLMTEALDLAREAIASFNGAMALYEEAITPAPSYAFDGDEGIK